MKIAVCDDDQLFLSYIKQLLYINGHRECVCYESAQALEEAAGSGLLHCDVLLMDICLEDDGIQTAKRVRAHFPDIRIIFISGYAKSHFETVFLTLRPDGFLEKPLKEDLLLELLARMEEENKSRMVSVPNGRGKILLAPEQILFLESSRRKILVHTPDRTLSFYGSMDAAQEKMPSWFIRCHKSFLVNPQYIMSYLPGQFILKDGRIIRISQSRSIRTREEFLSYMGQTARKE
ncbi:MAG: LytTR family DNA-binding domain-containing protein [Eubacteriales bacterium]|nr:LytTR family DNA-binding domain-containing protein [Eubacteriales bacterium]